MKKNLTKKCPYCGGDANKLSVWSKSVISVFLIYPEYKCLKCNKIFTEKSTPESIKDGYDYNLYIKFDSILRRIRIIIGVCFLLYLFWMFYKLMNL